MASAGERTAAVDVHVDCEWEGGASVVCATEVIAPLVEPLKLISPVMDVKVTESLTLRVPLDRGVIELSLPVEVGGSSLDAATRTEVQRFRLRGF